MAAVLTRSVRNKPVGCNVRFSRIASLASKPLMQFAALIAPGV
ncbi:MAG: hypothetical protein JWR07_5528 [Nevskia sp.]|nr:hypothetical protein [Nevskia sp.]